MAAGQPTFDQISRRALGVGLALAEVAPGARLGFDLAWTQTLGGRDLALIQGGDALGQDLHVALLTQPGSDAFHATFGFGGLRALTEPLDRTLIEAVLRATIMRTVEADQRVRRVNAVTVEPAVPLERRWRVDVEVQTVLGEALAIALGEVDARG